MLSLPAHAFPLQDEAHDERSNAGWLDSQTASSIDSVVAVTAGSPGYAVGIIKDGQLVYRKGFGLANLDDDVPITPDTSFHLASVSKQFTAAAIALLILDHKVSLADPVSK